MAPCRTTQIASIVLLVCVLTGVLLSADPGICAEDLEPTWWLTIEDHDAVLRRNSFADASLGKRFPRAWLRVTRAITSRGGEVSRFALHVDASLVRVEPTGQVADRDLSWCLSGFVSTADPAVLVTPQYGCQIRQWPRVDMQLPDCPGDPQLTWEWHRFSPQAQLAIVNAHEMTMFYDLARPEKAPRFLPDRLRMLATARDGSRLVGLAVQRDSCTIVVLDSNQDTLHRESMPGCQVGNLYVTPEGRTLVFSTSGRDRRSEIVCMDLREFTRRVFPLENVTGGVPYFSGDGSAMLVISPVPGEALYYKFTDSRRPILLWKYHAPSSIVTAAVCDDGSLVALQVLHEGSRVGKNVVVLDRDMRSLGSADQTVETTGLEFVNKMLFVGIQEHPYPASTALQTTTDVLLFDLAP